jgi:hypothetical protein
MSELAPGSLFEYHSWYRNCYCYSRITSTDSAIVGGRLKMLNL